MAIPASPTSARVPRKSGGLTYRFQKFLRAVWRISTYCSATDPTNCITSEFLANTFDKTALALLSTRRETASAWNCQQTDQTCSKMSGGVAVASSSHDFGRDDSKSGLPGCLPT